MLFRECLNRQVDTMIIRFILALVAIYLLYRVVKGLSFLGRAAKSRLPNSPEREGEDMIEDPYCHVYVPVSQAYCGTLDGSTRHFCSRECFEKFKEEKSKG